jgi:crossover junction endodeoxyribonuclease RuvC
LPHAIIARPQGGYPTRILGVDPGLNITGYGIIDEADGRLRLVEGGVVRTKAAHPLAERVSQIHEGIAGVIAEHRPDVVIVEELYSTYNHPRTAILMGHARGVIYLAAGTCGVPVESYTATRVKKSLTGNGNASKQQVQRMVCRLLGLDKAPGPMDVTDALALTICHAGPRRLGASGRRRRPEAAPAIAAAIAREAES